jgi:antirestriction protein ArdC
MSANNAYSQITDRVIELLERGTVPWRKPWRVQDQPKNLISGKPYRGINTFVLAMAPYESPYFVTYKQARTLGGYVRRGEKGHPVIFFKWLERERQDQQGQQETYRFPIARIYRVFNVEQCGGLESKVPQPSPQSFQAHREAESIAAGYENPPKVQHGGQRAFYIPSWDLVQMPTRQSFASAPAYYTTLFHELVHSTGHTSRLNRRAIAESVTHFGSQEYSQEELCAEMGACFLASECGLLQAEIEQSASYINGWLGSLKRDKKLVVVAASQAEKATNRILGRDAAEVG